MISATFAPSLGQIALYGTGYTSYTVVPLSEAFLYLFQYNIQAPRDLLFSSDVMLLCTPWTKQLS